MADPFEWIDDLSNQNLLGLLDVLLDVVDELQLDPNASAIPIIPPVIRYSALFPGDTPKMRDQYGGLRWKVAKLLERHGILSRVGTISGVGRWDARISFQSTKETTSAALARAEAEYTRREITEPATDREFSKRVFIVHGHSEEMKQAVARVLELLELTPIILHEKPNQGRTIIEKFEDYADVGFAVVLLSPDDTFFLEAKEGADIVKRARQNVPLELGFFIGKLGRDRVCPIFLPDKRFEMPSDYSGVVYIEYDTGGSWRYKLCDELRAAEYDVDANKL